MKKLFGILKQVADASKPQSTVGVEKETEKELIVNKSLKKCVFCEKNIAEGELYYDYRGRIVGKPMTVVAHETCHIFLDEYLVKVKPNQFDMAAFRKWYLPKMNSISR